MSKIELEYVVPNEDSSFKVAVYENAHFTSPLHFHPEYELVLIVEGEGLFFCGDHVGKFKSGDIMLYGKSLPHFYLSNKKYYESENTEKCKSIYIQFKEEILPYAYKEMPGFKDVLKILNRSERGLHFTEKDKVEVISKISMLTETSGFDRITLLYTVLNMLGKSSKVETLASISYENENKSKDAIFLKVINYINNNFQTNISLTEIAQNVNLSKSSLCRYFKRISGKNVFDYITEYRVSYACKLIANTDFRISSIAYDSGFNNISNFNRLFLSITGYSPKDYRKLYKNKK